jgi:prenyltransferase beta subunit
MQAPSQHQYDSANIAATYSALAILHSLGDDLSRVAREPILRTLGRLQQPDGRLAFAFLIKDALFTVP